MTTILTKPQLTPEDLLTMPNSKEFELVNGELVERKMGWDSSWIGGRLFHFLSAHCDANRLGRVVPADGSYQCFPEDPRKVRRPDVSFIRSGRLPGSRRPRGHCLIPPDLAVEVISPNELYYEVEEKAAEYFAAGVRLLWVINPPTQTVRVHRADGTVSDLREQDELNGEDVVPGFRCRVADLFADPEEGTPAVQEN